MDHILTILIILPLTNCWCTVHIHILISLKLLLLTVLLMLNLLHLRHLLCHHCLLIQLHMARLAKELAEHVALIHHVFCLLLIHLLLRGHHVLLRCLLLTLCVLLQLLLLWVLLKDHLLWQGLRLFNLFGHLLNFNVDTIRELYVVLKHVL